MRDAASAAAMSDPEHNRWFRRRWVDTIQRKYGTPTNQAEPPLLFHGAANSFDLFGRELLAAWRRERAAQAAQSDAIPTTVRGGW